MLSPVAAHAICIGLVAADYVARAWRIKLLAQGVRYRLTFFDAMAVNTIGDAACSVSPLRIAGEPARLAVMLNSGVPATASFVAITYEVLAAWPVILLAAGVLLWRHAAEWWVAVGPELGQAAQDAWPWVVAITLLTLMVWLWVRRHLPAASHHIRRPIRRILVHWRQMPWSILVLTAPLTFINLATRVAVLPVLASTLPDPPALGSLLVGSFALLYSQLVLPTPSGLGAIELGFMGGAAGNLGTAETGLLLSWRLYTTGVGVLLGIVTGLHRFGWKAMKAWLPVKGGSETRQ